MFRLLGFLVLALIGAGGIMFIDFNRLVQKAAAAETEPPSLQEYLQSVPDKLASLTASTRSATRAIALSDMVPRTPEGWTARPVTEADIAGFLPRSGNQGDAAGIERVKAIASDRVEPGATLAIQAYERGERRVVIQLVRLPDSLFTDPALADRRHELQVEAATPRGRPFLSVRGLDVTEEFLGEGLRARHFTGYVGAQIQLRILASRRAKDSEIVPFFETLNVNAMNAAVVDRQPGLGEIPVLVLASAMSESGLAAFEADRAARASTAIARAIRLRELAAAELQADASSATGEPAQPAVTECKTGVGGIKRCSVGTGG